MYRLWAARLSLVLLGFVLRPYVDIRDSFALPNTDAVHLRHVVSAASPLPTAPSVVVAGAAAPSPHAVASSAAVGVPARPPLSGHRRNLVVLSVGACAGGALPEFVDALLQSPTRTYDTAVLDWTDSGIPGCNASAADVSVRLPGSFKFDAVHTLLTTLHPELLSEHEFVGFFDSDVSFESPSDVDRLFSLTAQLGVSVSQASVGEASLTAHAVPRHSPTTLEHGAVGRRVYFVECMAPVLARGALEAVLPRFRGATHGWGIDFLWSWPAVRDSGYRAAVFDALQMSHVVPVSNSGPLYSRIGGTGVALRELGHLAARELNVTVGQAWRVMNGLFRGLDPPVTELLYVGASEATARLSLGVSALLPPLPFVTSSGVPVFLDAFLSARVRGGRDPPECVSLVVRRNPLSAAPLHRQLNVLRIRVEAALAGDGGVLADLELSRADKHAHSTDPCGATCDDYHLDLTLVYCAPLLRGLDGVAGSAALPVRVSYAAVPAGLVCGTCGAEAEESRQLFLPLPRPPPALPVPPAERVAVMTMLRPHPELLVPWVGHYRSLGVGRFYLYYNAPVTAGDVRVSRDDSAAVFDIAPELAPISALLASPDITLIAWPLPFHDEWDRQNAQRPALASAFQRFSVHHEWMLFPDVDEYLLAAPIFDVKEPQIAAAGAAGAFAAAGAPDAAGAPAVIGRPGHAPAVAGRKGRAPAVASRPSIASAVAGATAASRGPLSVLVRAPRGLRSVQLSLPLVPRPLYSTPLPTLYALLSLPQMRECGSVAFSPHFAFLTCVGKRGASRDNITSLRCCDVGVYLGTEGGTGFRGRRSKMAVRSTSSIGFSEVHYAAPPNQTEAECLLPGHFLHFGNLDSSDDTLHGHESLDLAGAKAMVAEGLRGAPAWGGC